MCVTWMHPPRWSPYTHPGLSHSSQPLPVCRCNLFSHSNPSESVMMLIRSLDTSTLNPAAVHWPGIDISCKVPQPCLTWPLHTSLTSSCAISLLCCAICFIWFLGNANRVLALGPLPLLCSTSNALPHHHLTTGYLFKTQLKGQFYRVTF